MPDPAGLNPSDAAVLLAPHLPPGLDGPLEPIGQGDYCVAFRAGAHVVRVARHGTAAAAIRREACVLAGVADHLPLPVPRLAYHAPRGGPAFTVHRELAGAVLSRDAWERLPPSSARQIAQELATFLRALHELAVPVGASCGLPRVSATELAEDLRRAMRAVPPNGLPSGLRERLNATLTAWSRPGTDGPAPRCSMGTSLRGMCCTIRRAGG